MHAPPQRLVALGHDCPQTPPEHVALPPVGTAHAVHDVPHDVTAVSDTQMLPQRCVPLPQTSAAPVIAPRAQRNPTLPSRTVGA